MLDKFNLIDNKLKIPLTELRLLNLMHAVAVSVPEINQNKKSRPKIDRDLYILIPDSKSPESIFLLILLP